MKALFLEIPVSLVREDERYPDTNKEDIYEHLRHLFALPRSFPLPAIYVKLMDGRLIVSGHHIYLRIARELGEERIRGILQCQGIEPNEVLKQLSSEIRVIPREELEREEAMPVVRDWHVYFFDGPLSQGDRERFLVEIAGFFERLETPLIGRSEKRLFQWAFPFEGRCAEFEALIPVGDRSWCEAYRKVCIDFSRNVHRIVSFQGARFLD
jgi:hypothetical protein